MPTGTELIQKAEALETSAKNYDVQAAQDEAQAAAAISDANLRSMFLERAKQMRAAALTMRAQAAALRKEAGSLSTVVGGMPIGVLAVLALAGFAFGWYVIGKKKLFGLMD